MSRAAPLIHNPVNGLLSALPFVNLPSGIRLAKVIRRLFNEDSTEKAETVMLHLSTTKGPVLLEMMARVVDNEFKPVVLMTGCEVDSNLATLIASESVISDADNEGMRSGNNGSGLARLNESSDHAPHASETESRGELRRLISEAECGVTHRGHVPDQMHSCHSEMESIREIESDDDESSHDRDEVVHSPKSERTSISALTLPTVFRVPTRDADHLSGVQRESCSSSVHGVDERHRRKPFISIALCNDTASEAIRPEFASSSESGYGADMGGRAVCETKWLSAARPSVCSDRAQPSHESSMHVAQAEDSVCMRPANAPGCNWDSESSGYHRRRESRAAFSSMDDLMQEKPIWQQKQAVARRSARRQQRHTSAKRNALVKLRVVGIFMRVARERAALRVLHGKLPQDLLVDVISLMHTS